MTTLTRRNKYGVSLKEDRTVDGIVFASKREATRYGELKLMLRMGLIADLELQPVYLMPPGIKYVADFRYKNSFGDNIVTVVEDAKGLSTPVFKLKMKLMAYFHPTVKVVLV